MTLVQNTLDRIRGRKAASRSDYHRAVASLANDKAIDPVELEVMAEAAGKTLDDISADVELYRTRREAASQAQRKQEIAADLGKVTRELEAAEKLRTETLRQHNEQVAKLAAEESALLQKNRQADAATRRLEQLPVGWDLAGTTKAIEAERKQVAQALQAQRERLRIQQGDLRRHEGNERIPQSELKAVRENVKKIEAAIADLEKQLRPIEQRLDKARALRLTAWPLPSDLEG